MTTKKLAEASFYHAGQVMMPDSLLASPGVNVVAVLRRSGLTGGELSITTGGPRDGPASEEGFRGVKGIGESGTIGAPAAVANAVVDALWHLGVRHIDMPFTAARVWRAIRDARG